MKKVGKVLVVDDNAGIRSALKILLPLRFEAVEILPSPSQLISTVNSFQPDVILLDMNFNTDINTGNEGLFWLSELRSNNPNQKVILFTAYADISLAVEGMKRGAFDFIVKPWENERLLATLERAVAENRKDSRKSDEYSTGPTGMYWGTSSAMAEIKKTIEKIGPTDATVLITGENGTGKDLLAREIHNHSERRNGPMVSVDAGAIPETLFESELFGHVKGAFTDAYADKAGKSGVVLVGIQQIHHNIAVDLRKGILDAGWQVKIVVAHGAHFLIVFIILYPNRKAISKVQILSFGLLRLPWGCGADGNGG